MSHDNHDIRKIIRVGWVGTGPFSFYGCYIPVINSTGKQNDIYTMRVTHIWGDDYTRNYKGKPEWVKKMLDFWTGSAQSPEGLAEKNGITNVCRHFTDMVDEVDAVMIMDFDRAFELSEPFLDKGMPVFLCSPVAVTIPECERILDRAESTGSAVHTGSFSASMYQNKVRSMNITQAEITQYFSSSTHHFFTSYANDGLEPLYWLVGKGVDTATLIGWNGSGGYDPDGIPLSRIHLTYKPRNGKIPVQGVLTLGGYHPRGVNQWFRVHCGDKVYESTTDRRDHELGFRDFLLDIQNVFTTNRPIETHDDILEKLRILIAAYKSANEGNRPVSLDEVDDYRLPTVRIEKWDEL